MIISWGYSLKVKIIELDLCNSKLSFEILNVGANRYNLENGEICNIDISGCRNLDFMTIAEEIENNFIFLYALLNN